MVIQRSAKPSKQVRFLSEAQFKLNRMAHNPKTLKGKRDKELIRLSKERHRLYLSLWSAPYIKLDEPIVRGKKRSFRLRADVARRSDAWELSEILKRINNVQVSRDGKFQGYDHKSKKHYPLEHTLKTIPQELMDKVKFPPYFVGKWFVRVNKWVVTRFARYERVGYEFRYPWMFESFEEPNILTHVKQHLPDIEARLQEVNRRIGAKGYRRLDHLYGNGRYWLEYAYDILPKLKEEEKWLEAEIKELE